MPYIYTLKNPAVRERKESAIPYKKFIREKLPVKFTLNPPSRVKSKKDRHALHIARIHGTKLFRMPDMALRNSGNVSRFSGRVEETRQFV